LHDLEWVLTAFCERVKSGTDKSVPYNVILTHCAIFSISLRSNISSFAKTYRAARHIEFALANISTIAGERVFISCKQ